MLSFFYLILHIKFIIYRNAVRNFCYYSRAIFVGRQHDLHDLQNARYDAGMSRPCQIDTVQFRRRLSDPERAVLLSAGAGDLTDGFHFILAVYAHVHGQGFRPNMDIERLIVCNDDDLVTDSR